jgi:hypothetical protein
MLMTLKTGERRPAVWKHSNYREKQHYLKVAVEINGAGREAIDIAIAIFKEVTSYDLEAALRPTMGSVLRSLSLSVTH